MEATREHEARDICTVRFDVKRGLNSGGAFAMIGRAGQNVHSPVDLLSQHHAGQRMGPGLRSESDAPPRPGLHGWSMTVRPADGEDEAPLPLIAQLLDHGGKGL